MQLTRKRKSENNRRLSESKEKKLSDLLRKRKEKRMKRT